MKTLTYFYLENCPYCKKAAVYMEELFNENPKYKDIEITKVEERKEPKIANEYDYYLVPCFFKENAKLAEGVLSKDDIKKVFEEALA